jgi:hypothetical protein
LLAALGAAVVLAAPAAAGITWSELSRGTASGGSLSAPIGLVAYARSATKPMDARIPTAKGVLFDVDYRHNAVVGVIGEFGCQDPRITVRSVSQSGPALLVSLVKWPLAAGKAECQALFPIFRLLLIAKAKLKRPYPSHVEVRLAPA